ncbi:MAG: MmgE/PrpD family protein, partial [Proteobacteria bacterium]|nr:MmgE/PrpD family protein [Pseudomonadota bacterium]
TSAPQAALVNGTLIHTIDFDDTHLGSISHLGASVVPSTLALGEKIGGGWADFLGSVSRRKVERPPHPGFYGKSHPGGRSEICRRISRNPGCPRGNSDQGWNPAGGKMHISQGAPPEPPDRGGSQGKISSLIQLNAGPEPD